MSFGESHQPGNCATPTVRDYRSDLAGQRTSDDLYGTKGIPLSRMAEVEFKSPVMWPTPLTADDGQKATQASHQTMLMNKAEALRPVGMLDYLLPDRQTPSGPKSSETRRRLNPLFVEWLMGWPAGLSGFDTQATASCHSPRPMPGCDCMDCWLNRQRQALVGLLERPLGDQAVLL
jgi:hypothetical protein